MAKPKDKEDEGMTQEELNEAAAQLYAKEAYNTPGKLGAFLKSKGVPEENVAEAVSFASSQTGGKAESKPAGASGKAESTAPSKADTKPSKNTGIPLKYKIAGAFIALALLGVGAKSVIPNFFASPFGQADSGQDNNGGNVPPGAASNGAGSGNGASTPGETLKLQPITSKQWHELAGDGKFNDPKYDPNAVCRLTVTSDIGDFNVVAKSGFELNSGNNQGVKCSSKGGKPTWQVNGTNFSGLAELPIK